MDSVCCNLSQFPKLTDFSLQAHEITNNTFSYFFGPRLHLLSLKYGRTSHMQQNNLALVNNELTGLTRLPLFHDVTSLWHLELSSSNDVFERFTFPVGDERWFSHQIDWSSIALH